MKHLAAAAAVLLLTLTVAACGGAAKTAPAAAPASPEGAEPVGASIGADECCCPFASAEAVEFNVSKRADCESAGSECVAAASCLGAD